MTAGRRWPGTARSSPYGAAALDPLPATLREALAAFESDDFHPRILGEHLTSCLRLLKRSEPARYEEWLAKADLLEHDEYFPVH
ncbi:hypothetical protein [Streptosporangium sp. CA-115845]|uniref:hypothetical protein n=1 Tax=Streptosporangium sp. CA-115845 TaxID=3240071 RepID=UPI003D8F7342